jgi:hypothetical protein
VIRWAFGTEVPEIDPNDLRDFPVVRLANDVEKEIANQVERANALRRQADEVENSVVADVEHRLTEMLGVGGAG